MSTRSAIGITNEDGTVFGIYCHWDGYLEGVGKTLFENYNSGIKVRDLMALGDISSLDIEIEGCKVYNEFQPVFKSIDDFVESWNGSVDYFYLFDDDRGEWSYYANAWSYKNRSAKMFKDLNEAAIKKDK